MRAELASMPGWRVSLEGCQLAESSHPPALPDSADRCLPLVCKIKNMVTSHDESSPKGQTCSVAIIGAGLEGLSIAARLPQELLKDAVVIDETGEWLGAWTQRCQRLGVGHLRTPLTLHPAAAPLELRSFVDKRGLHEELKTVLPGHAPMPSAALMADFCRERVVKKLPPSLRAVVKDRVVEVELTREEGADAPTGCRLRLASGAVIAAAAVVVACSSLAPVVPGWAQKHVSPGEESLKTWDRVDVGPAGDAVRGKTVVIVGGGMAAAQLALGALERKAASVTVVARRPLRLQPFDVDVGWWGAKRLNGFWQDADPDSRLRACRQARLHATLGPEAWEALAAAAAAGRVTVVEGLQVESAERAADDQGYAWVLNLAAPPGLPAVQQPTAFQQAAGGGSAAAPPEFLTADAVWLACGSAFNVERHPILSGLQRACPGRVLGGYPVIDPGAALWPGAPVYLIGRAAALAVGPAAGDLAGMRLAADRIAASLKRLGYAAPPAWAAAAEALAPQLRPAAAPRVPQPDGLCQLQPTLAVENYLALEEAGLPCFERRLRPSVSRPRHLVDVSDLPPALPRHELHKFSFWQEDFEVCVTLELPEGVPLAGVRTLVTERSLEVWAVGAAGAYRVHVPRLYGRVLPDRTQVKVNERKKKVFVTLRKERDAEWSFLKG